MRSNILKIKRATNKKFLLMVKADAYGHGLKELVPRIQSEVDAYGVADTNEAEALLDAGACKPILITGEYDNAYAVVKYGFTPFVFLKTHIEELSAAAKAANKTINAHIKTDTGMGRFGSHLASYSKAIAIAAFTLGNVRISGIATHYASGSAKDIAVQSAMFRAHIFETEQVAGRLLRHAASTYPSLLTGGMYDMLRIGLGAYGYGAGLTPVMSVSSKILAVKHLREGESAGYGGIFYAERDTFVAIIGGGYADGISRAYRGANVRIRNRLHKIAAVCMDNFIVELSFPCKVGDIAEILFPAQGAVALAKWAKMLPYEVLTAFRGRIKRIYDKERETEEGD